MPVNITIQTFETENELELSLSKWDAIKDKFMPLFEDRGLKRYSITRIWNKKEQYQLGHIFEYQDEDSLKNINIDEKYMYIFVLLPCEIVTWSLLFRGCVGQRRKGVTLYQNARMP